MNELPPNVYQALKGIPGATAVPIELDSNEAAVIVKAEAADIASLHRPNVGVAFRYELGLYPEGAAIRLAFEFHDRPGAPYTGECFINPAGEHDLPLLRHLANQERISFIFYDLGLHYRFIKLIPHRNMLRQEIRRLTQMALDHNATLPPDALNFVVATYKMQQDS